MLPGFTACTVRMVEHFVVLCSILQVEVIQGCPLDNRGLSDNHPDFCNAQSWLRAGLAWLSDFEYS